MSEMETLFDITPDTRHGHLGSTTFVMPDDRKGRHRNTDPETSRQGAQSVAYRAGSQKAKLLQAYADAGERGLTSEQAAEIADLMRTGYWKRASELRQDGLIAETDQTRTGTAGVAQMIYVITSLGLANVL